MTPRYRASCDGCMTVFEISIAASVVCRQLRVKCTRVYVDISNFAPISVLVLVLCLLNSV